MLLHDAMTLIDICHGAALLGRIHGSTIYSIPHLQSQACTHTHSEGRTMLGIPWPGGTRHLSAMSASHAVAQATQSSSSSSSSSISSAALGLWHRNVHAALRWTFKGSLCHYGYHGSFSERSPKFPICSLGRKP